MQYDINYFINKFEAIPEEKWITDAYGTGENHCAYGHCGARSLDDSFAALPECKALQEISVNACGMDFLVDINDGNSMKYDYPTPKQRILAALYDIKKMQQPVYEDITATLAREIVIGDGVDVKQKQLV